MALYTVIWTMGAGLTPLSQSHGIFSFLLIQKHTKAGLPWVWGSPLNLRERVHEEVVVHAFLSEKQSSWLRAYGENLNLCVQSMWPSMSNYARAPRSELQA